MNKKIIVTISGIRPDVIRMSHVFKKLDENFKHILIWSGQHYDKNLSTQFFQDLEIREPDYDLGLGKKYKTHHELSGMIGSEIIQLFEKENIKPDLIVFLGDSNSVVASIPLKKEGYKIAHIEAGMRSGDIRMLEEINRKCCDMVSDFLFVYHENYKQKALKENISEDRIFVVGNTIVEPLREIREKIKQEDDYWIAPLNKHIILDIHRPENFKYKNRLEAIIKIANMYSERYNLPVKMLKFPRTMQYIKDFKIDIGKIELVELMGFVDYVKAQLESRFIISDSGTAQEEPALLFKPVITPRDYTERPESIENNNSFLFYLNNFEYEFENSINWLDNWKIENSKIDWLGDGTTSERIINILKEKLV